MLASGAQATDIEASLRGVMRALGLPGAEAVVTYSTVSISFVAPGDAEATTAMQLVRDWRPDFSQLAAVATRAREIRDGRADLERAEAELLRIAAKARPYPGPLRFAAPGLSAAAATILFGGSLGDAATTLAIGLAIQPLLGRIERSQLPPFFQVVAGVSATALLVVLLVALGLPIDGGLVLTGGLLRFLPGNALVSGMRDLIDRSIMSGTARLTEGLLLAGAVAGGAATVLAIGASQGVRLQLSTDGVMDWAPAVTIAAGMVSVAFYAVGLGVPRRGLLSAAVLGGVAVAIGAGMATGVFGRQTLLAALAVGVLGRLIARRMEAPATLLMVPAILPLLPGLAIVQAMLAETQVQQIALLGDALGTAFAIGVGVASGDIVVATYQGLRERIVEPAVGAVSDGVAALIVRPAERLAGEWRQSHDEPNAGSGEPGNARDPSTAADET